MDEIILDCKVFFDIDDIEEELSCAEFLRIVRLLPAYKGALRTSLEAWANEHEAELADMNNTVTSDVATAPAMSAEQFKQDPRLGAAPAAGQLAPIIDVRTV
jgi:hypothetical protein